VNKIKLAFLTGTRADYGKLKPLMRLCDEDPELEVYIYVTGMHLLIEFGYTYGMIIEDGYRNVFKPDSYDYTDQMDVALANTILAFSEFIRETGPDIIVVHGDRFEPLAGAIVGVLNNIKVAHIEGGEVTGSADEFLRHAISKLSVIHFVANEEAKYRLIQLGERESNIHIIGSPDIDVMLSGNLPKLEAVRSRYGILFEKYAILIYHPVTTSDNLRFEAEQVVEAIAKSGKNYVIIYPNNDNGSEIIRNALDMLKSNTKNNCMLFKSLPFEDFLVLLKNSEFIIGNSSAGVREACIYGVPAIDIGTRQNGRYTLAALRNIQHTSENMSEILDCIAKVNNHRYISHYFGDGHSAEKFVGIIKRSVSFNRNIQKKFIEMNATSEAIMNYINEVCF
jgi:UDP-N-acetylglucosamine 2-epimerase (hydrolysing)